MVFYNQIIDLVELQIDRIRRHKRAFTIKKDRGDLILSVSEDNYFATAAAFLIDSTA